MKLFSCLNKLPLLPFHLLKKKYINGKSYFKTCALKAKLHASELLCMEIRYIFDSHNVYFEVMKARKKKFDTVYRR